MSDLFDQVTNSQDVVTKILAKIPGFGGYIERENRRAADKLLRDTVSNRFEEIWKRISALQTDLVSQGAIEYVDDLEGAAIKFRQFIDRVKNASYGYSGLFDAVKINEAELLKIYQYDLALLEMAEEANRAVDTVEASIGTDGLPAAIRNLKSVATKAVDAYNHRSEIVLAQ
ncbi:MAG: hypothetical protein GYA12_07600 [Chloroflexi bacterium]|nr:hypothetical protein [Chloroflexota bacterium]BCY18487.1 hypothetical protein hrd7_23360 [Leptolinea sp. HRD-7]